MGYQVVHHHELFTHLMLLPHRCSSRCLWRLQTNLQPHRSIRWHSVWCSDSSLPSWVHVLQLLWLQTWTTVSPRLLQTAPHATQAATTRWLQRKSLKRKHFSSTASTKWHRSSHRSPRAMVPCRHLASVSLLKILAMLQLTSVPRLTRAGEQFLKRLQPLQLSSMHCMRNQVDPIVREACPRLSSIEYNLQQ